LLQTSFGLKDSELFEPSMLYDFSDFAKVLQTLSVLSNSTKVKSARTDILPWSWSVGDSTDSDNNHQVCEVVENFSKVVIPKMIYIYL